MLNLPSWRSSAAGSMSKRHFGGPLPLDRLNEAAVRRWRKQRLDAGPQALSASSLTPRRAVRRDLARHWPASSRWLLDQVRNNVSTWESGRRESNPHDQLGRLGLCH
jgi:hypothetical protein